MKNSRIGRGLKRPRSSKTLRIWKRFIWDRIRVDPVSKCWIVVYPWTRMNFWKEDGLSEPRLPIPRLRGYVKVEAPRIGRVWAHRLSFLSYVADIPDGALVLHSPKCISRACVNPAHLRLGDARENARDRDKSGTTARGERNGKAKLRPDQVRAIRHASDSFPDELIALRFNISVSQVRRIRLGDSWREDR